MQKSKVGEVAGVAIPIAIEIKGLAFISVAVSVGSDETVWKSHGIHDTHPVIAIVVSDAELVGAAVHVSAKYANVGVQVH